MRSDLDLQFAKIRIGEHKSTNPLYRFRSVADYSPILLVVIVMGAEPIEHQLPRSTEIMPPKSLDCDSAQRPVGR